MGEHQLPEDPWFYDRILPGTDNLPFGIHIGHTWHEVGVLMRLINTYRVGLFVELGVHEGGLASLMLSRMLFDPGFYYYGVERDIGQTRQEVKSAIASQPRSILFASDIFAAHEAVRIAVANASSPAFVYCDGGDKPKELAAFKDVLRPGDLVGVHDFQDGSRVVRDLPGYGTRGWPTPEVTADDVVVIDKDEDFSALPDVWTAETRIEVFKRL